ncbi:class II aldolase/adducin family protein [Paenibacillus sp. HWE-109]|uniref:class II aldolase/adducin family protein n=1 Tax=Paenibacillus sp. HWE-109 TaxID=1306526 RepID=UPI003FCE221C
MITDGSKSFLRLAYRPSSEVLMHLFCYRVNPAMKAIVHTHPAYCIALTLVDDELPMLFPDQAALVGDVAFVPYVVPTTDKLANLVAEKADRYSSILLKNHGLDSRFGKRSLPCQFIAANEIISLAPALIGDDGSFFVFERIKWDGYPPVRWSGEGRGSNFVFVANKAAAGAYLLEMLLFWMFINCSV